MNLDAILQWAELVREIAEPDRLAIVLAMIWVESRGDAGTVNAGSGAVGLMQVMPYDPRTGETFAGRPGTGELLDPEENVRWGCRILEYYLKTEGGLWKALYRYSGGATWESYDDFNERYWMPFSEAWGEVEVALAGMDVEDLGF